MTSPAAHAYTATVIAVAPPARFAETAAAVDALRARVSIHAILVTLGDDPQPQIHEADGATIIHDLVPRYLNNAVASLRLSSLPTLAWWRGGDPAVLDGLATLVDRLVLDSLDPVEDWTAAAPLVERTAFSDLRWTRLTRWRNLMAQFFDIPDVGAGIGTFSRLEIASADAHAARLFAGWLSSRLPNGRSLATTLSDEAGEPLRSVSLSGADRALRLQLMPEGTCIETSITRSGQPAASRIVSLGDQALPALLAEELRVRARDIPFEQAFRIASAAR